MAWMNPFGFKVLCDWDGMDELIWWWKTMWKFKCSLKYCILVCLVLENKALTWHNLQKRSQRAKNRCPLCKECEENINCLIMKCVYSAQVWKEVEIIASLKDV
jgi:hypothetical protein